ncbi:MAG: COX15/CtaA family protein [Proteobacteria bacterium]|nr:COX15/CtaA family protein [Pseudomonadota bacterium]
MPASAATNTAALGPWDVRNPFVARWLLTIAGLVVLMVIVGGATRLTGSGLSITEWRPVTGAIPPMNAADWLLEFEKYRASPQYQLLNAGMGLEDFKFIYWWEWGHRQLGRFIGLAYLAGLILAAARGWVTTRLGVLLFGMGLVLGLQGAIGWIMVASGLKPGMIAVAPVKLTLHLGFACLFLASLMFVWARIRLARDDDAPGPRGAVIWLWGLIFLQILLGGFVAGSRAGLTYNTWPLMDGAFIPALEKLFVVTPWLENFVDNPTLVQFNHRMVAYLVLIVAVAQAVLLRRKLGRAPVSRRAAALAGVVLVQVLLGIVTLLLSVPLWAGLAHQALAVLILAKATVHLARIA